MINKTLIGQWQAGGLTLILVVFGWTAVHADMTRTTQEIAHLIDYIAASGCLFIRNGKAYDASTAREHIQKKYDYLQSRIRTAEDFIRQAASRSSMSGEPYRIQCSEATVLCADWLRDELRRYRQTE